PPPIEVSTIDSLLVHVTNGTDQPAAIHHHDMFFNPTSWMDGAMGVSQWYVYLCSFGHAVAALASPTVPVFCLMSLCIQLIL
ncbi:hypothetical protein F4604DRAFT_1572531, partial [Suillus subluteus]